MFLFDDKTYDFKMNIENIAGSYSKVNTDKFILTNIEKNKNKKIIEWNRKGFEISRENDSDYFFPCYNGTLVSSLMKKHVKKENPMIVLYKNISDLGSFFGKWVKEQIRFAGVLNWFHPWYVIRHRYFYRGY
jgi:hypothetical protein